MDPSRGESECLADYGHHGRHGGDREPQGNDVSLVAGIPWDVVERELKTIVKTSSYETDRPSPCDFSGVASRYSCSRVWQWEAAVCWDAVGAPPTEVRSADATPVRLSNERIRMDKPAPFVLTAMVDTLYPGSFQ